MLFNCKSVCGIKTSKGIPQVISGHTAMKGQFPWHIGLYKLSNNDYKYQCGGSIISEKLVITAAHCLYYFKPHEYYVAAGKYYKEWSNNQDEHAQFREVIHLVSPERYTGADTLFTADIAVLVTNKGFEFTNFIRPVCVDFQENFFRKIISGNENFAEVPGWGFTSEDREESKQLNYATLPIKEHEDCIKKVPVDFKMHVTADKICAGYTNGTSICQGDSGGGLVYPRPNGNSEFVYYIIGLVSTSPSKKGTCDSYSYTTFTEIEHYKQWINETVFNFESWSPYDYGCILPKQPEFGNYVVVTVFVEDHKKKVGELVQQYTTLKYECELGYRLTETKSIVCINNQWNNNHTLPICSKSCDELISDDLNITCIFYGVTMPCDKPLPHETVAYFKCHSEFFEPTYKTAVCHFGHWNEQIPDCNAKCGAEPQISSNSSDVIEGQYPWYAGIYKVDSNNVTSFLCIGTLIHPVLILINHKCKTFVSKESTVIAVGKVHRDLYDPLDKHAQYYQISEILGAVHFNVIVLNSKVKITSAIYPVCLPIEPIQPFGLNFKSNFKFLYWTSSDNKLKHINTLPKSTSTDCPHTKRCIFNYKSAIIENNDHSTNSSQQDIRYSGVIVQSVQESNGLQNIIVGTSTISNNKIDYFSHDEKELTSLHKLIKKYSLLSSSSNECIVPEITMPHIIYDSILIKPGDRVRAGTRVNFMCEGTFKITGSKSMQCDKSEWKFIENDLPFCYECGNSDHIINITDNYPLRNISGKFPWNVMLYKKFFINYCSGTLLTPRHVITGICSFSKSESELVDTVASGSYFDFFDPIVASRRFHPEKGTQIVNITQIIPHPSLLFSIVILEKPISITNETYPVCIDTNGFISNHMRLRTHEIFPGWKNIYTEYHPYLLTLSKESFKGYEIINNSSYRVYNYDKSGNHFSTSMGGGLSVNIKINKKNRYVLQSILGGFDKDSLHFVDLIQAGSWINDIITQFG